MESSRRGDFQSEILTADACGPLWHFASVSACIGTIRIQQLTPYLLGKCRFAEEPTESEDRMGKDARYTLSAS